MFFWDYKYIDYIRGATCTAMQETRLDNVLTMGLTIPSRAGILEFMDRSQVAKHLHHNGQQEKG